MPTIEKKDQSAPVGRKRTDKSLSAERAKTDASLSEERDKTERQADKAVLESRAEADEVKSVARIDADDTNATDERLRQERQNADEALESERRHMDSVLEHERSEKKAVQNKLFQTERKETDRNLTDERDQNDVAVQLAAKSLSEERSSHIATRAALTTRDEFLAIVSHDLKNPLGSISLAADLMKEKPSYASADEETREYLEVIGRNAAEALRLIGDLLDIEQIAVGKLGLQMERHDIGEIIRHTVATHVHQALAKSLSLDVIADGAGVTILCDRVRISQVLSNLVGNAIKFSPPKGRITLSAKAEASTLQISVADNGPGIPAEMRKIVFERFWQLGKADRRGLGLGLYISMMIIEAHGGRIWIDSQAAEGSTFHFAIPLDAGFPLS